MSKFDRNRIKHGWEKLCTNRQTDTTKIMVTCPWTNYTKHCQQIRWSVNANKRRAITCTSVQMSQIYECHSCDSLWQNNTRHFYLYPVYTIQPVVKRVVCCSTRFDNRLYTRYSRLLYTIQQVVKLVWQPVVSCKRGLKKVAVSKWCDDDFSKIYWCNFV